MDEPIIIIFICIVIPLLPALLFMEPKARKNVFFMVLGLFVCLAASFINGLILSASEMEQYEMTFLVTPLTEELLKFLPTMLYVFLFRPKKKDIISAAVMVGIGFAILENTYIISSCISGATVMFALIRGMGAGLMHGMCTFMTGYGLQYFYLRRKLAYAGSYALLIFAVVYHSCYNLLIQSEYEILGLLLPVATVVIILFVHALNRGRVKKEKSEAKT